MSVNSGDPDQTAPIGSSLIRSALFVIPLTVIGKKSKGFP